ncbi:hypothetical protein ONV78_26705 [Hahella sp. CR1]|uniref:hypothetical protein n=1 Tax=Hahella sp. CR1 TaxID=2992807 RepID=UPI00244230EF|nr:hypothetical protein [Hahella sp. CR1]MDG9671353.1 hypothetical protein [Hahella sp. CR1]
MSRMDFDVEVKLLKTSPDTILTPLCIPDFRELKSNTTKNKDFITFEIQVKNQPVDKLFINISDGDLPVFQSELLPNMRQVGTHTWDWDGYNQAGILDTKILKSSHLRVTVTAKKDSATKLSTISLKGEPAQEDWVDVKIDRNIRRAYVEIRLNLKDGGARGVGRLPPEEIFQTQKYRNHHMPDYMTARHIRHIGFNDLKQMVFSAVKKSWSRGINLTTKNQCSHFEILTKPIQSEKNAMDDIYLEYNANGPFIRSSNPGKVRNVISFLGNVLSEKIVYNTGWVRVSGIWHFADKDVSDSKFMYSAAHEIGHEILSSYGTSIYSYSHKGSSTLLTQSPKPINSGGLLYPENTEVDLMKYYNDGNAGDFTPQTRAGETDVKSLLWISRVSFK